MRRISHDTLRQNIAIQLRVQRGPDKTKLSLHGDLAAETVASNIIQRCLSGYVILAPDPVQGERNMYGHWGDSPGKFGETEPWPFEPGHRPPRKKK